MDKPHKIAILAYPQISMFELGCALELFALPRPEYKNWYQTEVVTFGKQPLPSLGGIQLTAKRITSLKKYSTIIIPGWNTRTVDCDPLIAKAVIDFNKTKKRIVSFCSGSFLPASLGILDGKDVTTHWRYAQLFQSRFPKVNYVDNVLYTIEDNIACSAGSASALDLGLEIIRQDHGLEVRNQIARRLVVSPHRQGGQSQFVERSPVMREHGFSATLDWAIEHLHEKISVADLANRANMSRRSFDRHFKTSLNTSPKEWINQQRLQLAQNQLEQQAGSIEEIAFQSGFENAMNLRHYFRKYFGISPSQYKAQFQHQMRAL